jgi:hypothetical protein
VTTRAVGTSLPGTLLAAALALLPTTARAQATGDSCQAYGGASAAAPAIVLEWLKRSGDERVMVCNPPAVPLEAPPRYRGESAVSRHGAVCSYSSHGLAKVGSGAAARLQRYERGDVVHMALAAADCPPLPAANGTDPYTATYDVSHAAFAAIIALWRIAAAATAGFDRASSADGGGPGSAPTATSAAVRARLRAAIAAGKMQTAPVIRIVRISGTLLRHRYALMVTDPEQGDSEAAMYVVYLSKSYPGPWRITGVVAAAR